MQFYNSRICGGDPLEGLAVGVARGDEMIDALHKLYRDTLAGLM